MLVHNRSGLSNHSGGLCSPRSARPALTATTANAERQRAAVATEMMENKDAEQYLKDLATQLFVMTRELRAFKSRNQQKLTGI